ncbi:MMPL family transporter [uncultured Sulfitobacter sp.]|uniref:efflux RND transporter permease subunit n=1 Tax=uncultured Sulfitobacter sp. TaxID=191468 RepID=UPI002632EEDC|nr:MMPL family transporter [uncultured Sulfitobacter sp.]
MFSGIGFGAHRIGVAACKFPKIATLFLIAVVVLIGLSLPKVSFDDNIHRVFLSESALSVAQRAYEQEQAVTLSTILIHVTSETPMDVDDLTALRDFSLDLEFLDGVTAIASPFVLRWPPEEGAPSGRPLFNQEITADFPVDVAAFRNLKTGLPVFLNTELTAMLITVSIDTEQTTIANAIANLSSELERALPAAMEAQLTGEDVISAEIVLGLKGDLIALNLWGALIVILAAFALLRDLRMAILAVIPALIGAAGALALSVWLGYPITVLSNVIPILLLVLGVADGVHLAGHVKHGGTVRSAVEKVGPACALTALTTAVAFASVTLTGNAQLFEFGVLGALGTMLSFILVIVTFALLGRMLRLSANPLPQFTSTASLRLTALGVSFPRVTILSSAVMLIVSVWGFSQTQSWFPLYQNLPDNSATLATNDAIAKEFGGVFQMIVETDGDWQQTHDLVEQLEAASGSASVLSEVGFARWLGHPDMPPTPEELDTLPQALVAQLRTRAGTSRVFVSVPEPMRNERTLEAFDALHDTAISAGAERIIGLPTVMRYEAISLINQLSFGLIAAALGGTFLVAVAFRSVRLIPILLVPNILPLMLTGASLHMWAQGQLSPTAVLALTIAFGIAIDDTVHFLSRYSAALEAGNTPHEAVGVAAKTAGQVMVLTTLLLTFGLCVTLASGFTPIRLFGGMMIVTLWAALLVDLLLLPALLTRKGFKDYVA